MLMPSEAKVAATEPCLTRVLVLQLKTHASPVSGHGDDPKVKQPVLSERLNTPYKSFQVGNESSQEV